MEIVFLNNLMEVVKDLEDDEILFCPTGRWAESYREELGGVIYNDEELDSLTSLYFSGVENFRVFDYHKLHNNRIDDLFLCVFKPGLVISSWKEIFEVISKNGSYLRNEVLRDVESIKALENHDLFVYKNIGNNREKGFIKSMVAGEVSEKLVKKEIGKKKYYLEATRGIIDKKLRELRLVAFVPSRVMEKGVERVTNYIKGSEAYVESILEGRKVLMVFFTGVSERGTEIETKLSVDYEKDKIYIAFGKVYDDFMGKTYLLGVPLFKGKIRQTSSNFRSIYDDKTIVIKRRKKSKAGKGRVSANLIANSFDVRVLFAEKPSVIELKGTRNVTIYDDHAKVLQLKVLERKESGETSQDGYKLCNIEIKEDGSFSVNTDYGNVIDVLITPIKGDGREPQELKELIDKRSIKISGRILKEVSYSKEGKRYLVLEESGRLDEISEYIVSSLYDFVKKMIRHKVEDQFPLKLSKEGEKDKELVETIQTGFIQNKINRILGALKKIVDLCFEYEGVKNFIKTHEIEDPEKISYEEALYSTGIDGEGLKGEEKSIAEVLKIISYSYPLMDRLNVERVFEELKDLTGVVFSTDKVDKVPIDEISVLVEEVNPEGLGLPNGYVTRAASSSALFLVEGNEIKVYAKGYRYEKAPYRNVKLLKIGLGDVEITIYS